MRRHSSLDPLDSIAYFRTFDFVHFILYLIMALLLWSYDLLENARVALVGRASEVLECARAFKRPRIQFKRPRIAFKGPRIQDFHRLVVCLSTNGERA